MGRTGCHCDVGKAESAYEQSVQSTERAYAEVAGAERMGVSCTSTPWSSSTKAFSNSYLTHSYELVDEQLYQAGFLVHELRPKPSLPELAH